MTGCEMSAVLQALANKRMMLTPHQSYKDQVDG